MLAYIKRLELLDYYVLLPILQYTLLTWDLIRDYDCECKDGSWLLLDHALIDGQFTRIKSILGYSEYFDIPFFLVQTRYSNDCTCTFSESSSEKYLSSVDGVTWISAYQMTETSSFMRDTVVEFFRKAGKKMPWQLDNSLEVAVAF